MTNNRDLTLRLTHPKYPHTKTYLVCISGQPSQAVLDKWREGLSLAGKITMPASIEVMKIINHNTLLKIILREGHNRKFAEKQIFLDIQ